MREKDASKAKIALGTVDGHLTRWVMLFHSLTGTGAACIRRRIVVHHINTLAMVSELKRHFGLPDGSSTRLQSQYSWNVREIEDLFGYKPTSSFGWTRGDGSSVTYLGIIPPLFTAAIRAEDSDVQSNAIALLKSLDCTEGTWNSNVAANIAHAIIQFQLGSSVDFTLDNVGVEQSDYGLRLFDRNPDCDFELFTGGKREDFAGFNVVSDLHEIERTY